MSTVNLVIRDSEKMKKIAFLSLNSPQNLNAISLSLCRELKDSLDSLIGTKDIGILVLRSDLKGVFSAGVDIKYIQTLSNDEASDFFAELSCLLELLSQLPFPTVAVVNGYTFGAGADFALACDLRIASASTIFRFPGPQFGLVLGTQRLINEIGASRARFLTLTNTKIDAHTALHYGLIHEICEHLAEVDEMVVHWIDKLMNVPGATVRIIKDLCYKPDNETSHLTKESVLQGDFKVRFQRYIYGE